MRGALPPVDLRAVCWFVLIAIFRKSKREEGGERRDRQSVRGSQANRRMGKRKGKVNKITERKSKAEASCRCYGELHKLREVRGQSEEGELAGKLIQTTEVGSLALSAEKGGESRAVLHSWSQREERQREAGSSP